MSPETRKMSCLFALLYYGLPLLALAIVVAALLGLLP